LVERKIEYESHEKIFLLGKIQQEALIQLRSAVAIRQLENSSHDISLAAKICILKLLMQHSGIYKSVGETEQNALIENDKKLLETFSSEFIVSQVFSYEVNEKKNCWQSTQLMTTESLKHKNSHLFFI
jgi:hypothetical protein